MATCLIKVALVLSIPALIESRLLRAQGPPANGSIDDQIAQLGGEIANEENEVADMKRAGVQEVELPDDFVRHCPASVKLALNNPDMEGKAVHATDVASLVNEEEFLLGLLLMHERRNNWSVEQELDAICDFARSSPIIEKLYRHHNASESLATQLAKLMDNERKVLGPTKVPPLNLDGLSSQQILATLVR
uniref:Uncharacterized protein n=1 Tax=Pyrodinium bahamense TaxID=73915 RepID=A0A7S0FM90_9DINO|mmetsp:Transcript_37780/g.105143  ORF Transcript_37780/g.105143 Transcript_37780/m.105143 type:complete len:191 (+) Transcript_37780:39-611(+)|eukprot:CAMPEP_0179106530 /NCGR_PEP_ID=MMETSP0796-20121207/49539_1 /TAXON_ID=73915 /ORGANISM="Pyrodinium bahamense, Strain pbaha01" /LENGTH=190 /DNA_ID=CAMNT_0020804567 /DNA_START=33 /DNA_END=605 /DNA_ORIENTATION=-